MVQFPEGKEMLLFLKTSRLNIRPTQSPSLWVLTALSPGPKNLVRETCHSPLFSAKVQNKWSYTSTSFMA
jgi:hypothetical protein